MKPVDLPRDSTSAGPTNTKIVPMSPAEISIAGAQPIARTVHQDPRGLLVETLRRDDVRVEGARFAMGYTSVTVPGQFRDVDRWHAHKIQTDRFVVPLGEMILALFDARQDSPSHHRLEVIRMTGVSFRDIASAFRREIVTYLVPIPPGVYHCIGNLSTELFVLQNYPTEFFTPSDEGRVPFADQPIPSLGSPFSWNLVDRDRSRSG